MKFISPLVFLTLLLSSCSCAKNPYPTPRDYPPYKPIIVFSEKIKPQTGLILRSYGINYNLPDGYQHKNGVGDFKASFSLNKKKGDIISIDEARKLIVFLVSKFVNEINSTQEVIPWLDRYPITGDLLNIYLYFKDENQIDLGQGVAVVYLRKGKIEYEGYDIEIYRDSYPARGKHFTIHEETYEEALKLVNNGEEHAIAEKSAALHKS